MKNKKVSRKTKAASIQMAAKIRSDDATTALDKVKQDLQRELQSGELRKKMTADERYLTTPAIAVRAGLNFNFFNGKKHKHTTKEDWKEFIAALKDALDAQQVHPPAAGKIGDDERIRELEDRVERLLNIVHFRAIRMREMRAELNMLKRQLPPRITPLPPRR